jgi:hypothetical protein
MKNPFSRRDGAEAQPIAADAREAKETSLRDVVVEQLIALARQGNVQAIKALLDRPSLLEKPVPKTREESIAEIDRILNQARERARAENPNYDAECFYGAITHRLEIEGEHGLARRWEKFSEKLKATMWSSIVKTVRTEIWPSEIEVSILFDGNKNRPDVYFEESVERRLKADSDELGLAAWRKMSADERAKLWAEIKAGLVLLGTELRNHASQTVQ